MARNLLRRCSQCISPISHSRLLHRSSTRLYHNSDEIKTENADVVILGGGMVGGTMACALGSESLLNNKRVMLLEAGPKKHYVMGEQYGNRTCTLSPGSIALFDRLGIWEEIMNMRCHKVLRMQVWESCSDALITFNQDDMTEELAYVAENDVILEAVSRRLDALKDNLEIRYNTRIQSIDIPGMEDSTQPNTWVSLKLDNGDVINTKLLVDLRRVALSEQWCLEAGGLLIQIGSDGMKSAVRKAADFHTISFNYDQMAVVAVVKTEETSNTVAWQRFLPTGPIAMLPMSDSACSLIWTTTKEDAKRLLTASEEDFVECVNDAFWHDRDLNETVVDVGNAFQNLLRYVSPEGTSIRQLPPTVTEVQANSRASFPLGLTHSSNYVRSRVALIGDAAHRIHPLAGQGVNLGFSDVSELTECLTRAVYNGSDLGSLTYLQEYETNRQRKILPVIATIEGLQRLYSTDLSPVVLLRTLGLQTTNALTSLKRLIVDEASR